MTRKPRALTKQFERVIETALIPGRFVSYDASFSFVRDLEAVERRLATAHSTDPPQAVALYETLLAGCYEKAEEIDDSSGIFGDFVGQLHCRWIKACQAAGADPNDIATKLVVWMEADPYGFCHDLEKGATKVLNKAGLAALITHVRERFDVAGTTKGAPGGPSLRDAACARRRWGEALRTLYLAQKRVDAYLALAEETGLTAADCHALATMLVARRKIEDGLAWVERGITLGKQVPNSSMAGYALSKLKRVLLAKQGRCGEALAAAWGEYREHPDKYSYADLMKYVPKAERAAWHKKAIEAATGSDLGSLIELLLETKELERLADVVRVNPGNALESISHYVTEPAAKKLEKIHPDVAARLWCAQGMRIVKAKKSKYYDAALSNFERARRCFERAGLAVEWQRVVNKVRSDHQRKMGFMAGFEEVVAGSGPSRRPSFLQRAKARWT
ncbi:MAG: hypothetical protein HYS05_20115 [Acidobacteria bacterium]|nr:hypothetical protein [Acidobacteriota bacterium]